MAEFAPDPALEAAVAVQLVNDILTPEQRTRIDQHVDDALKAIGGEDTDFWLTSRDGGKVVLQCRYQGCAWGESIGEMELWEFVTDAREHWEDTHK